VINWPCGPSSGLLAPGRSTGAGAFCVLLGSLGRRLLSPMLLDRQLEDAADQVGYWPIFFFGHALQVGMHLFIKPQVDAHLSPHGAGV